ncbi:hypothetical protein JTE90_010974 [Oedothorax gibbosus]|uniref:Uncharacterized protein n=1 Tax=Oedothorax gibbosus TaxID=931172 RepID=A0AAV6TDF0_9ARAC|nr:hypothetical protein JTE90_010974 [Oedothorax gibbosus]
MKVRARRRSAAFGTPRSPRGRGAPETRRFPKLGESGGKFERTRWDPKDGELCPGTGRGQRKLWWRSVAVLTFKAIVRPGV